MAHEGQEEGGAAAAVTVAPEAVNESVADTERADSGGHVSSVSTPPMTTQAGDKRVEWLCNTACSLLGVTKAHFEEMVTRDVSASKTIEAWLGGGALHCPDTFTHPLLGLNSIKHNTKRHCYGLDSPDISQNACETDSTS